MAEEADAQRVQAALGRESDEAAGGEASGLRSDRDGGIQHRQG